MANVGPGICGECLEIWQLESPGKTSTDVLPHVINVMLYCHTTPQTIIYIMDMLISLLNKLSCKFYSIRASTGVFVIFLFMTLSCSHAKNLILEDGNIRLKSSSQNVMPLRLVMERLQQICSTGSLSQIWFILENLFEQNNACSELLALNDKIQYISEKWRYLYYLCEIILTTQIKFNSVV